MHPFKKMIYMLRNETAFFPPEGHSYYVKVGNQTCVGGYVNISDFTYQTLYSNTAPLVIGSLIYTDVEMTTLTSSVFMQLTTEGDSFVGVLSGEVQDLIPIGSPC